MNIQELKLLKADSELSLEVKNFLKKYFDNFGTYDGLITDFSFDKNTKDLLQKEYDIHIDEYLTGSI